MWIWFTWVVGIGLILFLVWQVVKPESEDKDED